MRILALLACLALCSCTSSGVRIGYGPAGHCAKDRSIVGCGVPGQCAPYANELARRLTALGYETKVVGFRYQNVSRDYRHVAHFNDGAHAICVYRDTDGKGSRWYVKDNQDWEPQWIEASTALEFARRFAGPPFAITNAR